MAPQYTPENFLTIHQVSVLLNVHPNTLRRWCDEGKMPFVRISSRGDRRFRLTDVQTYLEHCNTVASGPEMAAPSSAT
jgi:excisionase family DNA binding protein